MEGGGVVEVEVGVMRVLLVDDSPVDRRVVELLLSNTCAGSFHVIAVDSAKAAMEFLGLTEGKRCATPPVGGTPAVPYGLAHLHARGFLFFRFWEEKVATFYGEGGKTPRLTAACQSCLEQVIDMVLTDYCMPEMTGYDLLKAIKALSPLKPIPVIVMSSENEPQRISRCLKAGAEDFIVKPLQSKDVQRLRNCSNAKPKDSQCKIGGRRKLPSDHAVVDGTSSSGRRAHFTGIAMVLHSSRVELSHYFPFLFKFILLVYAILCLGELLHRWSNGCFLSLWCA